MQIGYKWLKELVDFEWDAEELCDRLTMAGTACEVTGLVFEKFDGVVIGKIKSIEPHPSSENLKVCQVDIGLKTANTVCGAPNVTVGLKSAFAVMGAALPGGVHIELTEKLGVKSEGMLCSEKELGLSDDGSRIIELETAMKAGTDLWEKLELEEPLIEFELTPNRPDCMSAIGVAREIAALAGSMVKHPEIELAEIDKQATDEIKIEIENPEACPRYAARLIDRIKIGPSPFWLKRKLVSAGLRPINNVVDITNLVLMEYGHPLHAFDFSKFSMPQVIVRSAQDGEKFTTLDGEERELKAGDVLITDGSVPVALGGIMGGEDSEVGEKTDRVLLESAYFNPSNIRRTHKRLNIDSESAVRFEKGADPNMVPRACDYAAYLMSRLAGGKVHEGIVDSYPKAIEPVEVELRPTRVNKILATDISAPQMIDILDSLGFGVQTGKKISVLVPTFRPDCTREIDLVEEIGRIYGYDRIGTSLRAAGELLTARNELDVFKDRIRDTLVRQGLYEILTPNMIDPEKALKLDMEDRFVRLLNPLSRDMAAFRSDLFFNALQVVNRNLNYRQKDIKLFEIGSVAYKNGDGSHTETTHLGIVVCGRPDVRNWAISPANYDFFDLKGIVEDFCQGMNLAHFEFRQKDWKHFKPDGSFDLYIEGEALGRAGVVSDNALSMYDLELPVYYLEVELEKLHRHYSEEVNYHPLPRYPSTWRDIAVVVDEGVLSADLVNAIEETGGEILTKVELFDVYRGKQVEKGKKSLAFNLEFRSLEKTLTDEEVDPVFVRIIEKLKDKFTATLRT
jgi:phenylalanyl-tRNA synthetase beta chain